MDFFKALTYVGVFIGGIATAFGQGWVQDFFKKKQERRTNIEKFMAKVTDVVASSTASGYKDYPTGAIKDRLVKAAAHLERFGEKDVAFTVRSYMNNWSEYHTLALTFDNKLKSLYGEELKRSQELLKDLDKLTDKILSTT